MISPSVIVGAASMSKRGEIECGDQYLVQITPKRVIAAVVDGVGHGPEARHAADLATATIAQHLESNPILLVERIHAALLGSRGAVLSVAVFNLADETMTWLGVGNVESVLFRADAKVSPKREVLLLRGGMLGRRVPALREATIKVSSGDTLVMATDGVKGTFFIDLNAGGAPQALAESVLAKHATGTDDALVLAVRYMGRA